MLRLPATFTSDEGVTAITHFLGADRERWTKNLDGPEVEMMKRWLAAHGMGCLPEKIGPAINPEGGGLSEGSSIQRLFGPDENDVPSEQ